MKLNTIIAAMALNFAFFFLFPLVVLAQVVLPGVVPDPDQDPMGLVKFFVQALAEKNWLLATPAGLICLVAAARAFGGKYIPWLTTDRGGALLALLAAVGAAVATAALFPGPHSVVQVLTAVGTVLLGNQLFFIWLKKLLTPSGAELAKENAVLAVAAGTKVEAPAAVSATEAADALAKAGNEPPPSA